MKWSHSKYFPDRDIFLKKLTKRGGKKLYGVRTLKTDNIDWAHFKGVNRFNNGDTLISFRNFNMFVIVESNENSKKVFKNISLVHEPHRTKFGNIAPGRFRTRKLLHLIVLISNKDRHKYLFTGKYKTVRGIDQLKDDRFNVRSVGNILQIDTNGKIFYRMYLTIDTEDSERDLTAREFRQRRSSYE